MKERETWGAQFEKDDQYKISWLIHRLVATDLSTTREMIENLMYSSPPGRFTFNGAVKMVFDRCKILRERNLFTSEVIGCSNSILSSNDAAAVVVVSNVAVGQKTY